MRKIKIKKALLFLCLLLCIGCNQKRILNIQEILSKEGLNKFHYPKELVEHFPDKTLGNSYFFYSPSINGVDVLHYWGVELFVSYDNEEEKEYYLKNAQDHFKDTLVFNESNLLFLNEIKNYCDSIENKERYTVYPYPNVQKLIDIQSSVQNEEIVHSTDWKDYTYYVIERKHMVLYEEQGLNKCPLMEEKIDHGFSRGVVVNEKDKFIFFWLYFW